jgi:hypothetical protein
MQGKSLRLAFIIKRCFRTQPLNLNLNLNFWSFPVFKRFIQILAVTASIATLVACNGSTTTTTNTGGDTTTTTAGFSGTYTGTVTGLNAGPVTFVVSSSNVVSGGFTITNRQVDCASRGGTCETVVTGTVDAAGNIKGDFVDSGIATMHFNGKIVGDTITAGTWGEYIHDPVPDGAFSASRPAGSGGTTTTTTTKAGSCQGSYVGSIDPPTHEVRINQRNRQLADIGYVLTGNDAVDNAATGGGGEDGGIYLTGAFAFETDANCNIIKSNGNIFGIPTTLSGKVSSTFAFTGMSMTDTGPTVGSVDANGVIRGEQQEFGKEWVHGVMNGKFTAGGKI